ADRSITQTCAAIEEERRKLETELWAEFERKHPRILGALLMAVSHGLTQPARARFGRGARSWPPIPATSKKRWRRYSKTIKSPSCCARIWTRRLSWRARPPNYWKLSMTLRPKPNR